MSNTNDTENKDNISNTNDNSHIAADILTTNFETIAKAKGGVGKLRETILQLAVQGRLVPQNPEDEPASVLLEKIAAEKTRLVKEGKIKKGKPLPPVDEDEVPYDLPEGWVWCRFGTILSEVQPGFACGKRDDDGIIQLRMNNVNTKGNFIWDKILKIPQDYNDKIDFYLLKEGDILFNNTNSTDLVGKSARFDQFDEPVVFSNHFTRLRVFNEKPNSYFITLWLNYLWQSGIFKNLCNKWINQSAVNREKLINIIFPLPPLAEQHRIVERVDALMRLCDELEERQEAEAGKKRRLLLSSLDAVLDAENPEASATAREILNDNFDLLFDDLESIAEMRKSVLQLAVQGRLVRQDPVDEPASVLMKKIAIEKSKLVSEGKIKKQKALPPVDEDEVPYDLPDGWVWTRLDEISKKITDGEHFRPKTTDSGFFFLSAKDILESGVSFEDPLFVSPETCEISRKRCDPERRDLLIVSRGGGIGRCCLVDTDEIFCLLGSVILVKPLSLIKNEYLKYLLKSTKLQKTIISSSGATAQPAIYIRDVKKTVIPLPPLAEQHRIVERVDVLMKLCDELEERVSAREEAAGRLVLSVCGGICG